MASDERQRGIADPEAIFVRELETIMRAIGFTCRRAGLTPDVAEDFASYVNLKLIEHDYAIIGRYEARASFAAFISVVVQRLLLDYRIAQWGKWHASAKATRLGETAITIEAMLYRDGRTLDEAIPTLRRRWPAMTRDAIEELAMQLPPRPKRPREVNLDLTNLAGDLPPVSESAFDADRAKLAGKIAEVVRAATRELEEEDRLILRFRFEEDLSVAEISRTLGIEQKPLYRRIRRSLLLLRKRLEAAGITAADAEDVLMHHQRTDLDFGFASASVRAPAGDESEEGKP